MGIITTRIMTGTTVLSAIPVHLLRTTMGFTPTGGVMMGTCSGDLDPGVLLHLMHAEGYDGRQIERLVNHQAGLLGVSGVSPDMKTLQEQREREPHTAQTVELFCYQLRKHIGALTAVLGGIGERAAPVRWEVCRGLAYLGIDLGPQRNAVHANVISTPGSDCTTERTAFLTATEDTPPEGRRLCGILEHTGCRLSEALVLTAGRVEFRADLIVIETLKKWRSGVYRAVPVPQAFVDMLRRVYGLRQLQACTDEDATIAYRSGAA